MATNRTKIDFSLHTNTNIDNYNIYLGCTPPPPGCQWQIKVDKATIDLFIYIYTVIQVGGLDSWVEGRSNLYLYLIETETASNLFTISSSHLGVAHSTFFLIFANT